MPTWPTTLPAPLLADYRLTPIDQTLRTDMETGSPRVRRRTTARLDRINIAWMFDATQMAAFRAFFDDDLAGGTSWCNMTLDTGDDVASVEIRFSGPWQSQRNGRVWHV